VHTLTGWASLWFDYDHDGALDLYVCNGYQRLEHIAPEGRRQPNRLFHNGGDGTFAEVTELLGAGDRGDGRGCATGDLDGDGDIDLAIANTGYDDDPTGGHFTLLRNDAAQGHWLRVHVQGTSTNADGIGAVVDLVAGAATQHRMVSGGDGFLSSSQRDLHFGVGDATTIDSVTVRWPSGAVDVVEAVAADQTVTITEGTTP